MNFSLQRLNLVFNHELVRLEGRDRLRDVLELLDLLEELHEVCEVALAEAQQASPDEQVDHIPLLESAVPVHTQVLEC